MRHSVAAMPTQTVTTTIVGCRAAAPDSRRAAAPDSRRPSLLRTITLLIAAATILGGGGCQTLTQSASSSSTYYVVLGQQGDPLVAATALSRLIASPEARVAALRDIATLFIDRAENDNGSLVLENALNELNRSNTLDNDFTYPPSQEVSVHDPRVGSTIRAQLYLDILNAYQQLGEAEQSDSLLRSALNEILSSAQDQEHQQALLRYLTLANSRTVFVADQTLLSRPIEAVLVYRYPILYSDLLQFLIRFYQQEEQENPSAVHIFEQYMRLLIREHEQQDNWISLALYVALQRNGWISAAQINRIRARTDTSSLPPLTDRNEIKIAARGLARGNGRYLLNFYQQLPNEEARCDFAFADFDGLIQLVQELEDISELLSCIDAVSSGQQQSVRAQRAVVAAIRNDIFQEQLVEDGAFGSAANQDPAVYVSIVEDYLRRGNTARTRLYIDEFSARFDHEITDYQTASQFATFYGATHSAQQVVEQFDAKQNPLIKLVLLLELEKRYGPINTADYQQIIAETVRRLSIE